ncbi:Peptidoglycan/LPS O-acetylase OafA/YrhL, contains acyltransferase and SGNH-hydrolase domains [Nocardioides alpinus]|uniref:Acyltransferase n=1 Tax=Nocardioides alpinus TaxID=748909 RepID=A0A1I0XDV1_9ACTN|nr:acyltransferase [Nocardioides alpinus]PKH44280.1 acyltransferase [Nocardioides alpinus]SFA98887.1 Peptidoglycan/LPS O-acetylase OafA/YrhL, contains acyltransferase and SGNH-hydrolase domains [Nocardioides alpinus]
MSTTLTTPTPTDPRTVPDRRVFPLNTLRALAALSVVLFHAYQFSRSGPDSAWPWEGLGHQLMTGTELFVEMFFVLSGLVLWLPVARAVLSGEETRSGRAMLLRRTARLLPLYFSVVLVVWGLTNHSMPGHWQDLLLHLTFTQVYSDTYIFWTAGPAWSLAVEFHFYVLVALSFPVIRRALHRWPERRMAVLLGLPALLLVVGLAYNAVVIHLVHPDPTNWSVWFSPASRAGSFAVGMLLAVLSAKDVTLPTVPRRLAAAVGIGALLALVVSRPETGMLHWWPTMYAVALGVALSAVVLHRGPWARALSEPTLAWLGGLGYGIYLIHEPVLRLMNHWGVLPDPQRGSVFVATAVLVAVPTIVLAWISSRTVEAAGLRLATLVDRDGKKRDYYPHLAT